MTAGARTLTFLFSDIEGSTRLLERLGDQFVAAVGTHHDILREVITAHEGVVQSTAGDSFFATFDSAVNAVTAAVAAQRRLATVTWPDSCGIAVRMGLHTGETVVIAGEMVGLDINRAARIMSIGWGGQILVSSTTKDLASQLSADVTLRDLGDHTLKDLSQPERIHQVIARELRADFPALRSLDAVPHNLPVQLTTFVGREEDVADVLRLLPASRALTLTGPGGTGKTRLSLQVAAEAAEGYPDGAFFVPLASVTDPDLVMSAVAGVLGLTPSGDQTPLESVIEHLRARRVLLVLDNFEQVLPAAVDVSKLLGAAPDVTTLVSSRSALRIGGEQEYPVPPLALPTPSYSLAALATNDATQLFVTRAAAVDPAFQLTDDNATAIAEIVRRLDGLPLAIELAAARVKLLPVDAIASRLSDPLQFLSSSARDLPDRQRTLRNAIAWSYDLLDDPARRLFARASVFRGGFELDHLVAVCAQSEGEVLDILVDLVDHSLVRRLDVPTGVRFTMLETIRDYAAEQLVATDEHEEVHARHADVLVVLAEDAAPHLTGDDSGRWLDALERDIDNLRAALDGARHRADTRTVLRLVFALWRMWQIRGHLHEGRRNAALALALPDVERFPAELASAYEAAGNIAYWQGDLAASREPYTHALELHRVRGDDAGVANATYNLAFSYGFDEPAAARTILEEALAAYERLGDEFGVAKCHFGLAACAFWLTDWEGIRTHAAQCVPVFRAAAATFDLAWALHIQGLAEHVLGNRDDARARFTDALDLFVGAGDASGLYLVLADFALLAESAGEPERALRLFGAVARLADETGAGLFEKQLDRYPRARRAEDQVDAAAVAALRAEGYAMTRDDAVAYARELTPGPTP